MEALNVQNVRKVFNSPSTGEHIALQGIDLTIQKGELFFLLGASGCGKTTLLRCIAGLEHPTSGKILFGDRDVTGLAPHLREAAMVFQSYALWPHMSVAQNVAFGLEERGVKKEEIKQRVDEALAGVRLNNLGDRAIDQLSGGQQQRVALARALVVRPRCLLLDEPLSNLDAQLRIEMRREIRRIVKANGLTAIYVTHDQEEALAMADRMAVLHKGRLAQVGTPEEIYRRPTSAHVAKFIGETNLIEATVVSQSGNSYKVSTAAGEFTGRIGESEWKPATGEKVLLSIRPEAWEVVASATANTTSGKVLEKTYLGQRQQVEVSSPLGHLQVVMLNPKKPLVVGDSLTLTATNEDVIIVPKE